MDRSYSTSSSSGGSGRRSVPAIGSGRRSVPAIFESRLARPESPPLPPLPPEYRSTAVAFLKWILLCMGQTGSSSTHTASATPIPSGPRTSMRPQVVAEAGPSDLKAFSTAMQNLSIAFRIASTELNLLPPSLSKAKRLRQTQKKARKEEWQPTADMLAASAPAALLERARKCTRKRPRPARDTATDEAAAAAAAAARSGAALAAAWGSTSTTRKATGTRTIADPLALPLMAHVCPVVQSLMEQLSSLLGDYSPAANERASQRGCCKTRYCLRLGRSTNTIGLAGFELLHPIGRTFWYD